MGSSNNSYQQALHENKLLQMKILELKHKAALYEVCLGSIASILKDMPLQQNINDTKQSQNAALHKIANVLTHIESVVKSNSEPHLHTNMAHNPLHHHPSKIQFAWPGNHSDAFLRPYPDPRFVQMHLNAANLPSAANFRPGELQAIPSFKKPPPHPQDPQEYPHHVSTLSIHKCMKSAESQHQTVGAMTISPITISQNFPMVMRRSVPVGLTKTAMSWPLPQMGGGSHFLERKRILPKNSELFDELLRKKAAATATMEAAVAQELKQKQDQNHHVYRHTVEHPATNQQQKNDTGPQLHPMMMVQSGNPFLQEKRAHHTHMLNGGKILVNMSKVPGNDTGTKWHSGTDCCKDSNCNINGKTNLQPSTSAPPTAPPQPQSHFNQTKKVNQTSPAKPTSSSAENSANSEQQSLSDNDCTIIN